jgi:hypothetical protein
MSGLRAELARVVVAALRRAVPAVEVPVVDLDAVAMKTPRAVADIQTCEARTGKRRLRSYRH